MTSTGRTAPAAPSTVDPNDAGDEPRGFMDRLASHLTDFHAAQEMLVSAALRHEEQSLRETIRVHLSTGQDTIRLPYGSDEWTSRQGTLTLTRNGVPLSRRFDYDLVVTQQHVEIRLGFPGGRTVDAHDAVEITVLWRRPPQRPILPEREAAELRRFFADHAISPSTTGIGMLVSSGGMGTITAANNTALDPLTTSRRVAGGPHLRLDTDHRNRVYHLTIDAIPMERIMDLNAEHRRLLESTTTPIATRLRLLADLLDPVPRGTPAPQIDPVAAPAGRRLEL
jgi:hypothetical protein